jgi:hypothetical protein
MVFAGMKKSLNRAVPGVYAQLQEAWTSHRISRITRTIVKRHGLVVLAGPFAGIRYVPQAAGSSLLPKLLGSYEAELHPTLSDIISFNYTQVVDVGCAEGYYAVGLATKIPDTRVFAFDIDTRARQLCKELAKANGVADRVVVAGECTGERLENLIDDRTLVICDCEGCELAILNPGVTPRLALSDVLVELHDFIDGSISKTIVSRFTPTHEITLINTAERDPSNWPALKSFNNWDQRVAVAEFREDKMQWAFMRSRRAAV